MGTGTSQGVPVIAQPEDISIDLDNPKNWRTRSSIHLNMDGMHLQVDAAQEFRLQCIRENIPAVDVFFLTHGHADHILGMDDLRRFCDMRGGDALPVYSSPQGLHRIREVYPYAIRDKPEFKGYPAFKLLEMPILLELPCGTIESTYLPHGQIEVLGLVFTEKSTGRKLTYYTDCGDVPPEAMKLATGSDVVVLDGLRPQPHPSHMCIDKAVEVAKILDAQQTYFTHMTLYIDHDPDDRELPDGINFAWDGLRLNI